MAHALVIVRDLYARRMVVRFARVQGMAARDTHDMVGCCVCCELSTVIHALSTQLWPTALAHAMPPVVTALIQCCLLLVDNLQASSVAGKAIAASLEAACCCLQLLAAAGLPNSLYLDELLTAAVQVAKYQLQFNVLAFLHPPYRQLYRPSAITPGMAFPAAAG